MQEIHEEADVKWMRYAMGLAARAEALGEVPVGAVLVQDEQIVAEGWNISVCHHDPTAHAEIMVLRQAGERLQNYRLVNTTLYVTLEPCTMCAGALVHGRISRLVYGACDLKTGAVRSVFPLLNDPRHNHQIAVTAGVLADECSQQLSAFFQKRRTQKRAEREAQKLALLSGSPQG